MLPLIHLGHNLYIPTYFVWISFTYSLCFIYLTGRAEQLKMPRTLALDLALAAMIGGFIGARLFSVFYEEWPFYRAHPIQIVEFWHGGFVFYGGFFGAIIAGVIALKIKHEKFWPWADLFAPVMALGYGVGRIGCFMAGCCYGKLTTVPWAVTDHYAWLPRGPRHPTQLYAAFSGLLTFFVITCFEKQIRAFGRPRADDCLHSNGFLFSLWLTMYAVGRIIMEHFRDDWRGPDVFGLSVSTLISLALIVFALSNMARLSIVPKNSYERT